MNGNINVEELQARFDSTQTVQVQQHQMEVFRQLEKQLVAFIVGAGGHPRYIALAVTALEECAMWANKSITHAPEAPVQ